MSIHLNAFDAAETPQSHQTRSVETSLTSALISPSTPQWRTGRDYRLAFNGLFLRLIKNGILLSGNS